MKIVVGIKMVEILQWEIDGLYSLISMLCYSEPWCIKLMGFLEFCRNFAF